MERNFAMARPEGYRKAIRLMQMADRLKMPVLCFIDTPGAYPGLDAEERGQSQAIAQSIEVMFGLNVPSMGIVIGEGGSGGALAVRKLTFNTPPHDGVQLLLCDCSRRVAPQSYGVDSSLA